MSNSLFGNANDAAISACGRYRYLLTRSWEKHMPELVVVMLNPSTADATVDDPTIRRVIRFAIDGSFGGIHVLNLYALRSTDPSGLVVEDAIGPDNDEWILRVLTQQWADDLPVLAAWGSSHWAKRRAGIVLRLVPGVRWTCLGTTKNGSPRHPLYVRASQPLIPFVAEGSE